MNRTIAIVFVTAAMSISTSGIAGPREDLLAQYAAAAKSSGFSAERGQTLHTRNFNGGKPITPACTSCHGSDARAAGRTPIGKSIEAVAVSVTPSRYTDPAKVEKWFRRNCTEVLGRECTPQEKGDWLTFAMAQ
jgi:hypothetical protein